MNYVDRIEVTNAHPFPVEIEVNLYLYDGFELVRADREPEQKDGHPVFRITVPAGLTAIANGEMAGTPQTNAGKTTFVWREKHPMASYLATMTTGKFQIRTGTSAHETSAKLRW